MASEEALPAGLLAALPAPLTRTERASGGDICRAWRLTLSDGRACFAKTLPSAPRGFFSAEAAGLAWLAEADALRLPRVWASSGPEDTGGFLLLDLIEVGGPAGPASWEALGRGLAALHRHTPPDFGLDHDNFLGTLPQPNAPEPGWGWPEFYRHRRLSPLVDRAHRRGLLDAALRARLDRLMATLSERVGDPEPPARLHGDLWSGNRLFDRQGRPWLVDPAVSGGHREQDLAMMRLFGGFPDRVFDAYEEVWPLQPGWRDRTPLYQLYPLLIHLLLFGRGYLSQVEATARRLT